MASERGESFDYQDFFADVIKAVNDLHIDGFNALEDQIAKELDLSSEEELAQLKEGVDAVFAKVQSVVDKNFQRWESFCETNCFSVPERLNAADKEEHAVTTSTVEVEMAEDPSQAVLDAQLEALRSQILTVRRDCSKLNKECQTLETWLCSKRAKVDAVSSAASLLDDRRLSVIEEISKSVARLRERMKNAESLKSTVTNVDQKSKAAFSKRLAEG